MITRIFAVAICFVVSAGVIARVSRAEELPHREAFAKFPYQIQAWKGIDTEPLDERTLTVLGADDHLSRFYRDRQHLVGLFIAYYETQRQGDAMHSPLNCLPGAGWQPVEQTYVPISATDDTGRTQQVTVNKYTIEKGLDRQVVLYWYQSHGRVIANEYRSKIFMVYDAARLNRSDAALVRITSPRLPSDTSATEAEARAVAFAQAMFPALGRFLPP